MRLVLLLVVISTSLFANTPNMNLLLPTVGVTTGPQWASELNQAFSVVDQHDHSPGKGVQITPLGLSINTNLNFQANQAQNITGVNYASPGTQPTGSSLSYVWNNEFWFNNALGSSVQLTLNGHLNASAINSEAITASQIASGAAASGLALVADGAGGAHFASSSISTMITTKTSNYSIQSSDSIILCDATSGQVILTLPSPTNNSGKLFWIKKIDSSTNQCAVRHNASENIDGFSENDLKVQYQSIELTTNGSNWFLL